MQIKALINSMRLRTLPLSLAGVVCGGVMGYAHPACRSGTHIFLVLTAVMLQILTNLSNEMGDHLSGVDSESREGPNYSMADGGLTVKQMWRAINTFVVLCAVSGLIMLLLSFPLASIEFWVFILLGAAAIWAATHYTLGKKPYGYIGLGDLFVFIFFGLVSVLGSYYVIAHTLPFEIWLWAPAVGVGLLSVAVLNVNNIRDMQSDEGIRRTIPLRIGAIPAKIYQTLLVVLGVACFMWNEEHLALCAITIPFFVWHIIGVWRRKGKRLDPMLPLLVISTFVLALIYSDVYNIEVTCPYPIW
jgi:1,4-dihydroxy-2-naphthoate octaprenyltransferase